MQARFANWCGLPQTADMAGWVFAPYEQDGEVRAIAALNGTEIHFAINPAFRHRVITRERTRQFLAPLLDTFGFLTTRVVAGQPEPNTFLQRLGFTLTHRSTDFDHYMLCALPWGREN